MTFVRKLEVSSGITTLVLGLAAPFCRNAFPDRVGDSLLSPRFLLDALVLFIVPGLLVGIGSFIHSVQRKTWGFVLLLVGGRFPHYHDVRSRWRVLSVRIADWDNICLASADGHTNHDSLCDSGHFCLKRLNHLTGRFLSWSNCTASWPIHE